MSARARLFQLYRQWEECSESEGNAINAADWREVNNCQNFKQSLQAEILRNTELAYEELSDRQPARFELEQQVRSRIAGLMSLEARNSEWLSRQRDLAQVREAELNGASRTLQRVRSSYRPSQDAIWSSYS